MSLKIYWVGYQPDPETNDVAAGMFFAAEDHAAAWEMYQPHREDDGYARECYEMTGERIYRHDIDAARAALVAGGRGEVGCYKWHDQHLRILGSCAEGDSECESCGCHSLDDDRWLVCTQCCCCRECGCDPDHTHEFPIEWE